MRATYTRGRAILNGTVSASQVVVVSATLLLSYQLAVAQTSGEDFGLYSLFFTISMLTQLGSLGFGSGAAKHLANSWGAGRLSEIGPVIRFSLLVSTAGGIVGAVLIYPLLGAYMNHWLEPGRRELAESLRLPVLVAGALLPVSTALQGLMDGASRSYVRGPVVMVGAFAYLGAVWVWLPDHGVVALALASVVQLGLVTVVLTAYLFTITRRRGSAWLPTRELARSMTAYNVKIHLLTVPTLTYDPVVKTLLGGFAGLGAIAYFEIANRLLQQVNALILAANQAVVPLVAVRDSTGDLVPAEAFKRTFHVVLALSVVCFSSAILLLPVVGAFVFGEEGDRVVLLGAILGVGWVSMCLSGPAYFIGVTIDNFRVNVAANYGILALLVLLGSGLGWITGALGIAMAVSLAFIAASVLVNAQFGRRYGVSLEEFLPVRQRWWIAGYAVLVSAVLLVGYGKELGFVLVITAVALTVAIGLGLLELVPLFRTLTHSSRRAHA